VEIYHQTEGLIAVFPFAMMEECQQLFEQLLQQGPDSAYHIHIRDYKKDLIESWPKTV
jgi:hypothetical protein